MSSVNTVRQKLALERAKLLGMDKEKRRGYVFDYYLRPALITAVLLGLVIFFFYHVFFGGREILFEGAGVNVVISEEGVEKLRSGFSAYADGDAEAEFEPDMNITFSLEDTDQYAYANRMKLMAQVAAGEVDYFIMNKEVYEKLAEEDLFLTLADFDCELEIVGQNAFVLTDTKAAKSLGIESKDEIYLAFLLSSKKQDTILEYINYICSL